MLTRIDRPNRRSRIETGIWRLPCASRQASTGLTAGRGLKHIPSATRPLLIAASTGLTAGRG
ncbi:MAG: hypothetical protein ACYCY3_11225, partial [Halothiobacillus sp.]